jgi:hypothetical protein
MANKSSADVGFFLVDGYDILGQQTDVNMEFEALLEETTVLGDGNQSWGSVGEGKGMFQQNGFFNDAAGSNHAAINNRGVTRVLCIGVEGNVHGRGFIGFSGALETKYSIKPTRAALTKAEATYLASGKIDEQGGKIIQVLGITTGSATGEGTSLDNTASSANGGAAYLQVPDVTLGGYTSITFVVRHSADNTTFADKGTFTDVTVDFKAERIALAGTINRYVRSKFTFNGAGSGQSVTWFMGLVRY